MDSGRFIVTSPAHASTILESDQFVQVAILTGGLMQHPRQPRELKLNKASGWGFIISIFTAFGVINHSSRVSAGALQTFDISMSSTTSSATTGSPSASQAVLPPFTIPDAPGQTYDAADTSDTGTVWNSIVCPNNPSDPGQTIRETADLVDSHGNASTVTMFVSIDNSEVGIADANPSPFSSNGAGTDGLAAAPSQLMSQGWQAPGGGDDIQLIFLGLPTNIPLEVYTYGAGAGNGDGATFNLFGSPLTTTTTQPNPSAIYRSVFDQTGTNPLPEQGLSWTEAQYSTINGGFVVTIEPDAATGMPGSINGLQIQELVPEPASFSLVVISTGALIMRRRTKFG